jgi:hypothetical protein
MKDVSMQSPSNPPTPDPLAQGIAALNDGRRQLARDLLTKATEHDPNNALAWLWLSGAVATDDERRLCLERVVAIDPQNAAALRGLAQLAPAQTAHVLVDPSDPAAFPELPRLLDPKPAPLPSRPAPVTAAPTPVTTVALPAVDQPPLPLPPAAAPLPAMAQPAPKSNRLLMWLLIGFGGIGVLCAGCIVLVGVLTVLGKRVEPPIQAIAAPPTGWQKMSSNGASLWLPSSYVGGDVQGDRAAVIRQVQAQGSRFNWMVEHVQTLDSNAVLWAFDPASQSTGVTTNVHIGSEYVPRNTTMDEYLDGGQAHMGNGYRVVSREIVPRGDGEMGRMVLEASDYGGEVRLVGYVVKSGTRCWFTMFVSGIDEYDRNLAVFEQSMRTFAVEQP